MHRNLQILLVTALFAVLLSACQLPGPSSPTPFFSPTPNLTMTALFAPTESFTPTSAPVITATPPPDATSTTTPTPTALPPSPTPTSLPPTPTATLVRTGGVFSAPYLSTAPVIDGSWSEWNTKAYPARFVVYGANQWTNAEDAEASFRVGWDEDYLYLAMKVKDDKYVQIASGEDLFKGDSVELLLDVNLDGDFLSTQLSSDDFQIGISPGRPKIGRRMEAYLWFPSNLADPLTDVKIGAVSAPGLYRVEAAIPWRVFDIEPESGMEFGFAVSASDNDKADDQVQQTMVSSARDRQLANPITWGVLELTN